ncbi:hypothetical protein K431DRAFT_307065 [Polychaeton citri CBS 116435]|uniref:N-acetyltransferase domain-containing protein n=1 Tax=Polychaeton citri CBS 116435 TaxID=1314669 RepID=A0A9P4Q3C9_9PEZI|nr:hypothetical protein K431DRAFT_307065 [Polychaeton citri CBS 116435]
MAGRSEFVDCVTPGNLYGRLKLYDRTKPPTEQPGNDAADPARSIPQSFLDTMSVREEVYVKEQKVPLENELDQDDERSYHWVAYASLGNSISPPTNGEAGVDRRASTSTKIPIGTIRLVPPPHPPHPAPGTNHPADALDTGDAADPRDDHEEAYIKLGRLAVIKEFRKAGISRLLIETALAFAREHPYEMTPTYDPSQVEALKQAASQNTGVGMDWKGLVLVHAQEAEGVQKVWRRHGFEKDDSMGVWVEEEISHVGMWKRLDVAESRRKSKVFLNSGSAGGLI